MAAASAGAARRRRWAWRLALALAVCVLWAVVLAQAERSVFGLVPVLDEVWYLDRAAALDGLGAPADEPHFMSPLYPVLIKLAGAGHAVPADRVVPGSALRGLRLLQIACWLGTAVLLRLIAGRLLPADTPRRGVVVWLPAACFACYRPAAVYALAVLLELPLVLLVTSVIWLLVLAPGSRRPLLVAAAAGTALGLAGLLRGTALVLVPAAAWWLAVRSGPRRVAAAAVLLAATAAVLAPASLHNARASGSLAGPTLNGGVNLMIGNGPRANGFYVAVIDGDWRADPAGTEQLAGELERDPPGLAEADRIWTRRALASMADRPLRTIGLWSKKIWLHLQAWEIDQLTPLSGWTATVPALRLLAVPWSLIVVLAVIGAVDLLARRAGAGWTVPLAACGLLLAAQSLFFVVSRYRLALLPAFALLAAAGAAALLARRRLAWVVAPLVVLLVVPWGLGGVRQQWRAMGLANEALRRSDLGLARGDASELERAAVLYREALAGGAAGEAPWLGLAAVLAAQGKVEAADRVLDDGARALPHAPGIHKSLASRALEAGDADTALAQLRTVLQARPRDADSLHNLAVVLGGRGDFAGAEAHARRLVGAHPLDPRGWNDLGIILARTGRRDEAAEVFRQGLAALPGQPELTANLARLGGSEP